MQKSLYKSITTAFFLVFAAFLIYSCQKELSGETGTPPNIINNASVEGRVTDESGMPVYNAIVKAGVNTTQTDRNGIFRFSNAGFTTRETFVTVQKEGYFTGSRTFFKRDNSNNFVKIQLLRKTVTQRMQAADGGDVELRSDGGSISFQPNSFQTGSGLPYDGTVMVAAQYLNPSLPDMALQMPGDLRGENSSGNTVGLKSYAMVAVELLGENGQLLQLKPGSPATINLAVPQSKLATAPATIPLWYFNDSTGLWKQEGAATLNGDRYIGTVSHFSFWNCDDPYEYVMLQARVVNNSGQPVAGAMVQLSDNSGTTVYDFTDNNGNVDGYVPKNQTLNLQVLDVCGQAAYSSTIGPFSADANLGNITIIQNTTSIQGTAVNCTGGQVTDGYIQVLLPGGNLEFAAIVNGAFSATFMNCSGNTTAQLIAVDNGALVQGLPVTINLNAASVNAGQLTACGVSSQTFFSMTVGSDTYSGNSSEFIRQGWKEVWDSSGQSPASYVYAAYDATVSKYIYLGFEYPNNYVFNAPLTINFGADTVYMGYGGMAGIDSYAELRPLSATVPVSFTEYGPLGQFIAGSYSGQVERLKYDSTLNSGITDTVNVSVNFRVRHVSYPF